MAGGEGPRERDGGAPPDPGLWVVAGLLGYPILAWALRARLSFPTGDAFFLAALLELLPVLAIAQVPLVERFGVERIPAYVASGITVSTLGLLATLLGVRAFGVDGLGLVPPPLATLLAWTVGLCLCAGTVVLVLQGIRRRLGISESPALRELLPRTPRERFAFTLLALAAGVGEELAFRGYALPALAPHLGGPWEAALFTSLTFGLLHAYQGPLGMARTTILGLLLAASFIVSGSLWPAMLAHVLLDLGAGLVLGERLTR